MLSKKNDFIFLLIILFFTTIAINASKMVIIYLDDYFIPINTFSAPTITKLPPWETYEEEVVIEISGEANNIVYLNGVIYGVLDSHGKLSISLDTSGENGIKNFIIFLKDNEGNSSVVTKVSINKITNPQLIPPIIILNGEMNMSISKGQRYEELGARAIDLIDGNVSVEIIGDVNSSLVGTYLILYIAKDSVGNESNATRRVSVLDTNPILKSLVLNQNSINLIKKKKIFRNYYFGERYSVKVMGVYSDGHSEELTDHVTWTRESDSKDIGILSYYLQNVGNSKLRASIGDIQSDILDVSVQKESGSRFLVYSIVKDKNLYSYRGTRVDMKLRLKTTVNVRLKLTLDEDDKVKFQDGSLRREITFKPSTYSYPSNSVVIVDNDINNTLPYTITIEPFESDDTRYDGQDPSDIEVTTSEIVLAPPPIEQRRGAIRGVSIQFRVLSESTNLEYKLINPLEGMTILGHSDLGERYAIQGVDIQWDVPMDMEEIEHEITVEAIDREGNKGEVSFFIKVPKTKEVETKIVNNELIVTDKNSTLYGMKMKGHSGEDISDLKIRIVDYLDVWRKRVKPLDKNKKIDYIHTFLHNLNQE